MVIGILTFIGLSAVTTALGIGSVVFSHESADKLVQPKLKRISRFIALLQLGTFIGFSFIVHAFLSGAEPNLWVDIPLAILIVSIITGIILSITKDSSDIISLRNDFHVELVKQARKDEIAKKAAPEHSLNLLHLIELAENHLEIKKSGEYQVRDYENIGTWSGEYQLFGPVAKHINLVMKASESKFLSSTVALELTVQENAATMGLVSGILADDKLIKHLLSAEGAQQREALINDLRRVNDNLENVMEKAAKTEKQTKVNELNQTIEDLRRNTFKDIVEVSNKEIE